MKLKKTNILYLIIVSLPILSMCAVIVGIGGGMAAAYKCNPTDYYDSTTQTCRAYKDVTSESTQKGDGSVVCPSNTHHQDGGKCWAYGGDKQNYPPKMDDGKDIPASDITCPRYSNIIPGIDRTYTTIYDPEEYTCKVNCSWTEVIENPIVCSTVLKVDPDIPEKDPSDKSNNPEPPKVDACDAAYPVTTNSPQKDINLHTACKDGQGGADCDKIYKNFKDDAELTVDERKAACKVGAADKNDQAAAPDGSVDDVKGRCGQARVNLLDCGTDEGAGAFNNVLKIILQVLTVLVGIAAVGGIAYAAVTYARAEDNSGLVSEARTLIRNIVIGILLYGFLIAIISWLVPGLSIT